MPQFLKHEALTIGDPNFEHSGASPIGTIIQSVFTQDQLDEIEANIWQLCDGSTILAGSTLAGIDPLGTGNVPDVRGRCLGTVGGSSIDTAYTDKILNESLVDNFQSHRHTLTLPGKTQAAGRNNDPAWTFEDFTGQGESVTQATSNDDSYADSTIGGVARFGAETRPATYVVNMFIKVN